MTDTKILAEAKQIFIKYLQTQGSRKTPERNAILEEIYTREDHFDADALYNKLRNRFKISKATVYNTLELLIECKLVSKHHFGHTLTRYEKAYGNKQHDHLICNECNKILEFCDPRIHQIKSLMGELMKFEIKEHALNLYGTCPECLAKQKVKENQNAVEISK